MISESPKYYDAIFTFINSYVCVSKSSFDEIVGITTFREAKAGTILEDVGDMPKKVYLIAKGNSRAYIRLENGKEVTKSIFSPFIFFTSIDALFNEVPSEIVYECLTDCEIYEIDYTKYKKIRDNNIEVLRLHAKLLEFYLCAGEKKEIELLTMDATQRYLKLRKTIPNIDNLIPQYQIANYLSITPVQLSRIRSKL